jgi:hypothetical protein
MRKKKYKLALAKQTRKGQGASLNEWRKRKKSVRRI